MSASRIFATVLSLLGAFACTRSKDDAAPPSTTTATTTAPSPVVTSASARAPAPPTAPLPVPIDAALLWTAGPSGVKTVWLEPGKAGVVVKRERAEPIVATKRGLFALRTTAGSTARIDAEPLDPSSGPAVEIVSATTFGCGGSDYEKASVSLLGAVGPIIFAVGHGHTSLCDTPHPQFSDPAVEYDLDARANLARSPFPDLARLTEIARAKFITQFGDDGGGCIGPNPTPALYSATFAYDGRGVLKGHYIFTAESNYMCGTGPGHYTAPMDVFDSALPTSLAPWQKTPSWLVPYFLKHPSLGVSVFPPEIDGAAATAAFESPMPPTRKKP
jgi:hypothetical protein